MRKYHIGKSNIKGRGIILAKDIKKREVIFVFKGREIEYTRGEWRRGRDWLQVGYVKWVAPSPGSPGAYLNHSCDPTAGVRGKNTIIAIRDLKKGEEVTIDYALSETYPLWHMRCQCGAKNCRKVIKPYQDLSDQRKAKYAPYTSKYILDMKMHLSWQEYLKASK
ncbi:MAG TPA: SET domain-containing protein [Candidatus Paceibacterota bacterium]|jgi:hypothetical protein|nr:SET domain-containing protein [Candidatus Paceibacterota bacterium]